MGQKRRQLDPTRSAVDFFGAELRVWRDRRGFSLDELARLLWTSKGNLGNIETGVRFPNDRRTAERADEVLGTDGALARLWDFATAERDRSARASSVSLANTFVPASSGDFVIVPILSPGGTVEYMRMSRRAFLASGLATATAAGTFAPEDLDRLAQAIEEPSRADVKVADYFRRMLAMHKSHDYLEHPSLRVGTVTNQMNVLDRLRQQAKPAARKDLLGVQAEYAEYAGWLHQNLGNTRTAHHWTDKATSWAHSAGDYQMVTFTEIRKGNLALWDNDPEGAVHHTTKVDDEPWDVPPGLRSLAAEYRARGRASLGDEQACLASLDCAQQALADRERSGEDRIHFARIHDTDHFEVMVARCYMQFGVRRRIHEAIAILEGRLDGPRTDARQGGDLAALSLAYARASEPHAACEAGDEALDLIHTATALGELHETGHELEPWATEPFVRRFRERLAAHR